jgi:hypothetical protein
MSYPVILHYKVKHVAKQVKTFVLLLTDDSRKQDPDHVIPLGKFIVDCNAEVLLGCFVKYTYYYYYYY